MKKKSLIHSIGTVGIRKHFNQDYLFHFLRTDFVGGNGIGKSIIANLIQLIFISDKKLINLGEEGTAERRVETLPYHPQNRTLEAYTFLNIEIEPDSFYTIGVQITPSHIPLLTFFIISEYDRFQDQIIPFTEAKLPSNHNFLENDRIVKLEDLSEHLRSNFGLKLKTYGDISTKKQYYKTLFQEKILPFDLSIESKQFAFSRIIHSFSRTKTFDFKNSESIKQFLFGNEEGEYNEFQKKNKDLDISIASYNGFTKNIEDLRLKQNSLHTLWELFETMVLDKEKFQNSELAYYYYQSNDAEITLKTSEDGKNNIVKLIGEILEKVDTNKTHSEILDSYIKESETKNGLFEQYKSKYSTIKSKMKEVDILSEIEPFTILESFEQDSSETINKYNTKLLSNELTKTIRITKRYKTLEVIKSQLDFQKTWLEKEQEIIKTNLKKFEKIADFMKKDNAIAFFDTIIRNNVALLPEQEATLFYLIERGLSLEKPIKIEEKENYAYTDDLFAILNSTFDIEKNTKGHWLNLGKIVEYITPLKGEQYFEKNLDKVKEVIEQDIKTLIENTKLHQTEIDKVQEGKIAQNELKQLKLPSNFDLELQGYFNEFLKNLSIWRQVNFKIESLNQEIIPIQEELEVIETQLPFCIIPNIEDIGEVTEELSKQIDKYREEYKKLIQLGGKLTGEVGELKGNVNVLDAQISSQKVSSEELKQTYEDKSEYFRLKKLDISFLDTKSKEEAYSEYVNNMETSQSSEKEYADEYRLICNTYFINPETQPKELKEQLKNQTYLFTEIERSLLFEGVKHRDKIPEKLEELQGDQEKVIELLQNDLLEVFKVTLKKFNDYNKDVNGLNSFFKGKKIAGRLFCEIKFKPIYDIKWIDKIKEELSQMGKRGEIDYRKDKQKNIVQIVEELFASVTKTDSNKNLSIRQLLNPKTYFDVKFRLTDANGKDISGSTGESYSAIVLLSIARLKTLEESKDEQGVRFIILEELANLDDINFNLFMQIAVEEGFQLITMTPKPYGTRTNLGWYMHQLLKGMDDDEINSPVPASYFKTGYTSQDLEKYLKNELDSTKSTLSDL
jgi:DNA repair protein SbcC/Rad50